MIKKHFLFLTVIGFACYHHANAKSIPTVEDISKTVSYPSKCDIREKKISTGLCLLGKTSLIENNYFLVRKINDEYEPQKITLNQLIALSPGDYFLYRNTDLDADHEQRFTIKDNKITTIKTATLSFARLKIGNIKLQHFQASSTPNGIGCQAEIGNATIASYLPGSYQAKIVSSVFKTDNTKPECESNDVVNFNVIGGQTLRISSSLVTKQNLLKANRYQHVSSAYSLTNIGSLRHDVNQIGFLPKFTWFRNIYNSYSSKPTAALVLSGFPNFDFIIPITVNTTDLCGVSLAVSNIPAKNLMTECVFDSSGKLTRFRVNSGSYYGYNNTHGKSAVDNHTINSPFIVSGVKFNLKGN